MEITSERSIVQAFRREVFKQSMSLDIQLDILLVQDSS